MMTSPGESIYSIAKFEVAREKENYAPDTGTVLHVTPFMDHDRGADGRSLGFQVSAGVVDRGDGKGWVGSGQWEARLKERSIVYVGDTPEAAIGHMLAGVARLAYDGHMHPDRPIDQGAPPIQHVINILTDRLKWQTERREEAARGLSSEDGPAGNLPARHTAFQSMERCNQIIAALGTAIAALGRVNDL